MAEMIIKNGVVYDPKNGVDGERNEICIKDGKIVDNVGAHTLRRQDQYRTGHESA